jgi:hypothetical protein
MEQEHRFGWELPVRSDRREIYDWALHMWYSVYREIWHSARRESIHSIAKAMEEYALEASAS